MKFFSRRTSYPRMTVHEVQKLLIDKLVAILRQHGFKHSGGTFYRQQGELTHIISLVGSKWNQGEDATYYVDLAVYYASAYEVEWGDPRPDVPKEYDGQLRNRLTGKDVPMEWEFSPKVDKLALADRLAVAVATHGLAYFEDIDTPLQLTNWIMDKRKDGMITIAGHISRAIILSIIGDRERAQIEFDEYFKNNKYLNNDSPVSKMIKRQYLCIAQKTGLLLDFPELNGETCVGFYIATKGKQPVHDERRTRNKLELFLSNLEKKGFGYTHHYGSLRKPGAYRIAFCTKDPATVVRYIEERNDKFASPLQTIIANDEF